MVMVPLLVMGLPETEIPVPAAAATDVTVPVVGVVHVGVAPVPADVRTWPLVPCCPSKLVVPVTSRLTVLKFLPKNPSRQFLPLEPMSLALSVLGSKSEIIRLLTSNVSVFEKPKVALLFTVKLSAVKALTPVTLPVSSIKTKLS